MNIPKLHDKLTNCVISKVEGHEDRNRSWTREDFRREGSAFHDQPFATAILDAMIKDGFLVEDKKDNIVFADWMNRKDHPDYIRALNYRNRINK